jgi:seryl-tRNA synthetase
MFIDGEWRDATSGATEEAMSPATGEWLEVSSCTNFRDYQARRMAIRYRPEAGARPQLLHTLNGSGLALARTLAALLETHQQQDGSVRIPASLQPYLRGLTTILP